jgi:hypothetical protein
MRQAPSVVVVGASCLVATMAVGSVSRADTPKYKSQPLILEKRNPAARMLVDAGRARMKKGDCEGAIDAFDDALRLVVDFTIERDRGICREKLGFTFPAIDDYRAYLTALPDASDAEDIRGRLARLEGNGAGDEDSPDAPPASGQNKGSSDSDAPEGGGGDQLDYVSRDDSIYTSPLRAGKGIMLYPFFAEHKWVTSGSSFGDASSWSESIGLGFRYSFNTGGALVVEAGYERFNATDVNLLSMSGLTSLVAYEFRFPILGPRYDNQFFFAPGLGYEHIAVQSSDPATPSSSEGAIVPRVRFGYRRMLGHATSFDASLDGGATKFFQYTGPTLIPSGEPVAVLIGLNLAFVWGI